MCTVSAVLPILIGLPTLRSLCVTVSFWFGWAWLWSRCASRTFVALCLLVVFACGLDCSFVLSSFAGGLVPGVSGLSFFLLVVVLVLKEVVVAQKFEGLISTCSGVNPLFPTAPIFRAVCVGAKTLKLLVYLIFVLQGQCFRWLDSCPSVDGFFQKLQCPCGSAEDVSNVPEASERVWLCEWH